MPLVIFNRQHREGNEIAYRMEDDGNEGRACHVSDNAEKDADQENDEYFMGRVIEMRQSEDQRGDHDGACGPGR